MKTKVINLISGPGTGKSTTACGLYYNMKINHIEVELVREYVKNWAWEGKKINHLDQIYIMGKQAKYESLLYNKVPYVITDSPILLSAVYDCFYNKTPMIIETMLNFYEISKKNDVEYIFYFLERTVPYIETGRYETQEKAIEIDNFLKNKLFEWNIPFKSIDCLPNERIANIMNDLEIY